MNNKNLVSLTGDRPTGPLHLGHFLGSLSERIKIQEDINSFVMIADAQAYTDHIKNREKVSNSIFQVLEDYIAVGIDPSKTTIFLQSAIPEIQELSFYLGNIVTVSRLERIPTVRKEIFEKYSSTGDVKQSIPRNIPVGFLTYAVSQSSDILSFDTDIVPVGNDQLPIIELTNEIAKSFNYVTNTNTFKQCKSVLSEKGILLGIDGKSKMSKTLKNTINLNLTNDEIVNKVKQMYTDPNHIKISDPGNLVDNTVFYYLDIFYKDRIHLEELKNHYQRGGLGDMTVKKILINVLIEILEPIQKRRSEINKEDLKLILKNGTERAREKVCIKVSEAKNALGLNIF